jgi:hypothetical protein
MNGHYKIPIPPDVEPAEYPRVKALLRALDPGAVVTITRVEGKLSIHDLNGCNGSYGSIAEGPFKGCQAEHYAEIRASGGKAKRRAPAGLHPPLAPPIRTLEQCQKQRTKAEKDLASIRAGVSRILSTQHRDMGYQPEYDTAHEARQRKTGRVVARIIARHKGRDVRGAGEFYFRPTAEDYAILDKALGEVPRLSKLNTFQKNKGYLGTIVREFAGGNFEQSEKTRRFSQWAEDGENRTPVNVIAEYQTAKQDLEYWRELEALAGQREHFKPGLSDDTRTSDDEIAEPAPAPIAAPTPKPTGWFVVNALGRSVWVSACGR